MQRLEKQLQQAAAQVTLSHDEQALMRERLVEYMGYKPLRMPERVRVERHLRVPALFQVRHLTGALAIALIVTVSTASVSSAAADSLPGDLLYPVKVHVNEGVKTVFISGDEAQIAWERERAEMRLEEASTLASQGRLDEARKEVVAKQLAVHTEAVVEKVRKVEASDPVLAAEASAELADTLDTHKTVLARVAVEEGEGEVEESARALVEVVHRAAREAVLLRDEAEEKLALADDDDPLASQHDGEEVEQGEAVAAAVDDDSSDNDAEVRATKERAAGRAADRARELHDEAQTLVAGRSADDPLTATAQRHVDTALVLMAEGDSLRAEGRFGRAYTAYREAATAFHKVTALIETADVYAPEVSAHMLDEDVKGMDAVEESEDSEEGAAEADAAALDEDASEVGPALGEDDAPEVASEETWAEEVQIDSEVVTAQTRAQEALDILRGELGAPADNDSDTRKDARALMRDAAASMLGADSAQAVGNHTEALELYAQVMRRVERARALLVTPAEPEQGAKVQHGANTSEESGDDIEEAPVEEVVEQNAPAPLVFAHTYNGTVHTYAGSVPLTGCATSVTVQLAVAEVPQSVLTLTLTTEEVPEGTTCEEPTKAQVVASTSAPADATLTSVVLDGTSLTFEVVESTEPYNVQGWWRRAIDASRAIFGGE